MFVLDFLSLNKSTGDLKVSARIPAAVEATLIEVNATNVKSPFQRDTALLKIIFVSHKIDAPTFSKSVFQESVDEVCVKWFEEIHPTGKFSNECLRMEVSGYRV